MSNLLFSLRERALEIERDTGIKPEDIAVTPGQLYELIKSLPYKEADALASRGRLDGIPVVVIYGPMVSVGKAQVWARGQND